MTRRPPRDVSPASVTAAPAYRNAVEAVRLWVKDAEEAGDKLPRQRTLEALRADPDVAAALAEGAAVALVPALRDSGRSVRANLSLDAGLLEAIDEAADAHGLTRAWWIKSTLIENHLGFRPARRARSKSNAASS